MGTSTEQDKIVAICDGGPLKGKVFVLLAGTRWLGVPTADGRFEYELTDELTPEGFRLLR